MPSVKYTRQKRLHGPRPSSYSAPRTLGKGMANDAAGKKGSPRSTDCGVISCTRDELECATAVARA